MYDRLDLDAYMALRRVKNMAEGVALPSKGVHI